MYRFLEFLSFAFNTLECGYVCQINNAVYLWYGSGISFQLESASEWETFKYVQQTSSIAKFVVVPNKNLCHMSL